MTLGRSEDAELGVRLEQAGVRLCHSTEGFTIHGSDHTDLGGWLRRAYLYGVFERRIAAKHPGVLIANPWRWFDVVSPGAWPLMVFTLVAPGAAEVLVTPAMRAAGAADAAGLRDAALKATNIAYALQYMRGLRDEEGSLAACWRSFRAYRDAREKAAAGGQEESTMQFASAVRHAVKAFRADHEMLRAYDSKYASGRERTGSLGHDLVYKVGLQMMAGYRLMRLFREAGVPVAPQAVSRMVRYLYGADIHWEAEIDEGVAIVHGWAWPSAGSRTSARGRSSRTT